MNLKKMLKCTNGRKIEKCGSVHLYVAENYSHPMREYRLIERNQANYNNKTLLSISHISCFTSCFTKQSETRNITVGRYSQL